MKEIETAFNRAEKAKLKSVQRACEEKEIFPENLQKYWRTGISRTEEGGKAKNYNRKTD